MFHYIFMDANILNKQGYDLDHSDPPDHKAALKCFLQAAELGHEVAMANVALFYRLGRGCKKSYSKSFQFSLKAAQAGHVESIWRVGWHYRVGVGVAMDPTACFTWGEKAAQQNHVLGFEAMGWCYKHGIGCQKNQEESLKWYTKAAEGGHVNSMSHVAWILAHGSAKVRNLPKAVIWYERAAKEKDIYSMIQLADYYEEGTGGVTVDPCHAFDLRYEAAHLAEIPSDPLETGLTDNVRGMAYFDLASCYHFATGCVKDQKEARVWYHKAAALGDGRAWFRLARLARQRGDLENSTLWFEKSSEIVSPRQCCAKLELGLLVKSGKAVLRENKWTACKSVVPYRVRDRKLVVKLLKDAAEMKCEAAARALGILYEYGNLVPKNLSTAFSWYLRSASRSDSKKAVEDLVDCYTQGIGCEIDLWRVKALQALPAFPGPAFCELGQCEAQSI